MQGRSMRCDPLRTVQAIFYRAGVFRAPQPASCPASRFLSCKGIRVVRPALYHASRSISCRDVPRNVTRLVSCKPFPIVYGYSVRRNLLRVLQDISYRAGTFRVVRPAPCPASGFLPCRDIP